MAKLYDISSWSEQSWFNTGGTRDKKIYLNPEDGELYYFKQSFKKGQRDYKYEFWSEIIASEIGDFLGFNILHYHIAVRTNVIGCISKSMIKQTHEELIEGGKYLHAFDNTFTPENMKLRNQYSFELIHNTLIEFEKEHHIKELIETIVFDSLIGNSDRHQENWAIIINSMTEPIESITEIENGVEAQVLDRINTISVTKKIKDFIQTFKGKNLPEIQSTRLMRARNTRFAPIYDSGCSFGRELSDERVVALLKHPTELQKYVSKGFSEIHWEGNKITHFELLEKLLNNFELKKFVLEPLKRIIDRFEISKIDAIVKNIDSEMTRFGNSSGLPEERKQLVLKLLNLRSDILRTIYAQYT